MTGQVLALAIFVALVLGVLPILLRDELGRAQARIADRRLGGWWVDYQTGNAGRSRLIPYGTMIMGAFSPPWMPPPPTWITTPDDFERQRRVFMAEERIAMSILRPQAPVIVCPPS